MCLSFCLSIIQSNCLIVCLPICLFFHVFSISLSVYPCVCLFIYLYIYIYRYICFYICLSVHLLIILSQFLLTSVYPSLHSFIRPTCLFICLSNTATVDCNDKVPYQDSVTRLNRGSQIYFVPYVL